MWIISIITDASIAWYIVYNENTIAKLSFNIGCLQFPYLELRPIDVINNCRNVPNQNVRLYLLLLCHWLSSLKRIQWRNKNTQITTLAVYSFLFLSLVSMKSKPSVRLFPIKMCVQNYCHCFVNGLVLNLYSDLSELREMKDTVQPWRQFVPLVVRKLWLLYFA